MAPAKGLKGVSATVIVADEPTTEYELPAKTNIGPRKTIRYIEAKAGEQFKIQYDIQRGTSARGEALLARVYVDGKRVSSFWYEAADFKDEAFKEIVEGQDHGLGMHRFCFNDIKISEASNYYQGEEDQLAKVGTITLRFYHVNLEEVKPPPGPKAKPVDANQKGSTQLRAAQDGGDGANVESAISEKALVKGQAIEGKQALSHRIGFIKPVKQDIDVTQTQKPTQLSAVHPSDVFGISMPLAEPEMKAKYIGQALAYEIEFRYRSIHAIKSMMDDVDITTLPPKKLSSWQKQLKEEKAAAQPVQVKSKRKRENKEQGPRKKFVVAAGTEVIELD